MKRSLRRTFATLGIITGSLLNTAWAGEVIIMAAEFQLTDTNRWNVSVTLLHDDSGWEHYADKWQVVDAQGAVLGERVLFHPHVSEQPFTRNLVNVVIPQQLRTLYIRAHDKVHGWAAKRLQINLNDATQGQLRVEASTLP